ncbi:hypothetical protein PAHAL_4G061700 [Panicum hallii]|uniref:IBH1-like N-terminal domain-containing protein n=1 Tax=Panicum hallii TaxID=206008 RepID=A0A2S3HHG0_9POAL|nr:transcription factor IBH1-like 1 [Panicum hallii]PAN23021.1 hypothetical protein PAHAL_4G061700 [Panicum hallii]
MCCLGSQPHAVRAPARPHDATCRPAAEARPHSRRTARIYITAMETLRAATISLPAFRASRLAHCLHLLLLRQQSQGRNMRGPSAASAADKGTVATFKRDLLRNLLVGLRARAEACSFDAMSLQERKRAVKCSADEAMAAAREAAPGGARARWTKAVLAAAAASSSSSPGATCKARRSRCKRVVRRCVGAKRMGRGCYAAAKNAAAASTDVARRLVRRRTMALRKVIPGGDAARDEAALIREAMDYVVHLRAQVDVLRRVSAAVQRSTILRDPAQSTGES